MPASEQVLHVFLNETPVGLLSRLSGGKLTFAYDSTWLERGNQALPLSLSMPLSDRPYSHETIHPWIWGLLPDNELVITRWAKRFHVSATNAFGLLEHMGEDCAGAVRFVRPEALDQVNDGGKEALTKGDIERRLKELKGDPAMSREPQDRGQFSLAGAQSKTALQREGSTWYIPWGKEPTTHILKPPRADISGHVENEHFCLRLASMLGLEAARTEILHFGSETAIVVERYDRITLNSRLIRLHQEDACQALGIHPGMKYESDGGPGIGDVMGLMNRSSRLEEDRRRLMEALAYNYLIVGTDAHAKNFSLLLGVNQQVRLARLYDLASFLPYLDRRKDARFAMKIGGYYKDAQIRIRHFDKLCRDCEFPPQEFLNILTSMAERMPPAVATLQAELMDQGIQHPIIETLGKKLPERCANVLSEISSYKSQR